MTRQRKALFAVGLLVAILGAAYYWFFIESPGLAGRFDIDINEVRRLAGSIPGEKPREIRYEHVMDFKTPDAATVTGAGWSQSTLWGVAFQLRYSDHTAILETTMNGEQAKASGMVTGYYPEAYGRVIQAMSKASLILVTHEHADHIGGLAAHPELKRLLDTGVVKLNKQQVSNAEHPALPEGVFAKFPDGVFANYKPIDYDRYLAIAPGIVLIKDPGHTLGSQMIFVRKSDGTELLFLGDVAWIKRNIESVRGKPRIVSNKIGEEREAVLPQLAAVHALAEAEPKLVIVPGHDSGTIAELASRGVMSQGFQ